MHVTELVLCVSLLVAVEPLVLGEAESVPELEEVVRACSSCEARQHIRTLRLNTIKTQLLSKLHGARAAAACAAAAAALDQYDVLGDDNHERVVQEDDEHATTDTIMFMATEPDPLVQVDGRPQCCLFSFGQKLQSSRVVRAQLWVHLRPSPEPTTVFLQISRLAPGHAGGRHIRIRSLKLDMKAGVGSWQSIDVKQVLSVWLRQPETNWGIEVKAFDSRGHDLAVTSAGPGDEGLTPFLEVKMAEPVKRLRRDVGLDCDVNSSESRCCRYPLTVDFEDFGYDWIIAPKRFKANYCSGECEYTHLQKYPHTHLVNNANPRGTAGPCCTPTKMSPINMLYFNHEEQIIYGKIPSMVVDRCGCLETGLGLTKYTAGLHLRQAVTQQCPRSALQQLGIFMALTLGLDLNLRLIMSCKHLPFPAPSAPGAPAPAVPVLMPLRPCPSAPVAPEPVTPPQCPCHSCLSAPVCPACVHLSVLPLCSCHLCLTAFDLVHLPLLFALL
ncbi:hypothetical protein WMY93_001645 [Mugilogobius chulae]|uniref:Growth/differentiation factor 8 n=1 Tax=Mugilogobius chulae TaxID=88201 RepID=A0AAW0PTY9_9GOBI